ncbi:MAG: hypothetical protein RR280_10105 [Bacteroidaceae bacterium]
MKNYIYILCAVLMGVFASCSKSEMGGETPLFNQVTLKVATDEGLQTRGVDATVNRYAIEVYTDANYTTPATEVFGGSNKSTNATGEFAMTLDRTQTYHCLLWADKNGEKVYNIESLKSVTLTGNAVEAWHGKTIIIAGTTATLTATLTRAVSKIILKESGKLKAPATLKLNFSQPTKFDVATEKTSVPSKRTEETIPIPADVAGTTIAPIKLNPIDIFVLSSKGTADLTDLTFKYKEEAPFTVWQAPLKANFITNISGHYTSARSTDFTVTAEGKWDTPNNEVAKP